MEQYLVKDWQLCYKILTHDDDFMPQSNRLVKHPLDFYYWPTPNGKKVLILLHEMNMPYQLHMINIGNGDQFKPEFLAISPNNRIPALLDSNHDQPLRLFESGCILMYLTETYPSEFLPKDPISRVKTMQWLFWQMGGLGPMAGQKNHFVRYAPALFNETIPYAINRYTNEVKRLYGIMNQQLTTQAFIAGDQYTIADMACYPWVYENGIALNDYPALLAWKNTIAKRPAVVAAEAASAQAKSAYDQSHALNPDSPIQDSQQAKRLFGNQNRGED